MNTLLLDRTTGDLVINASGNIAMASDPYSVAQDIASACRLFYGELWYNKAKGVFYNQILGKYVSLQFVKAQLVKAALTVPEVLSATCYITALKNRQVSGQVQFTYNSPATAFNPASILSGTITLTEDGGLDVAL